MLDLHELKAANPIEDVIKDCGLTISGRGNWLKTVEHDSLAISVNSQFFEHHSTGAKGDVIDWVQYYKKMSFSEAIRYLAERANIPYNPAYNKAFKASRARSDALNITAQFMQETLKASPAAMSWAKGRGWHDATISAAGVGYWDGNKKGLLERLRLHEVDKNSDIVQAVLNIPSGMFIYAHYTAGRCVYLSARGIKTKFHYNLKTDLAGEKQPYFNHEYSPQSKHVVIVEGQADALTLAQWSIGAVATAGTALNNPKLIAKLKKHDYLYIGFDNDQAGQKAIELAEQLGGMVRIVTWPQKDPNEWLTADNATSEQCRDLLAYSPTYALYLAQKIGESETLEADELIKKAFMLYASLPQMFIADNKKEMVNAMGQRGKGAVWFNAMLKAAKGEKRKNDKDDRPIKQLPNGYIDNHLFEMMYKPSAAGGQTFFAVRYPTGEIKTVKRLELDTVIIEPLPADLPIVEKNVVKLASELTPYESEASLLNEVRAFIHRFVDVKAEFEKIASYYVLYTYHFDSFEKSPYLARRGDYGGGKTRFLKVLGQVCFRAYNTNGTASVASIFRDIEEFNGLTVCMDEADNINMQTDHGRQLTALFNCGYDKTTGIVPRVDIEGTNGARTIHYKVFGPKIVTQRQPFPDDATNSRCLIYEGEAGGYYRKDIPAMLHAPDFKPPAQELRNKLLYYRLQNWQADIKTEGIEINEDVPGRLREIVLPLKAIFTDAELHQEMDSLLVAMNEQAISDRYQTLEARIIEGILRAWYKPTNEAKNWIKDSTENPALLLALKFVAQHANAVIEEQNSQAESEEEDQPKRRKGKGITERGISITIKKKLNLPVRLSKDATHRNTLVEWDEQKMVALCRRYGLYDVMEELEKEANEERAFYGQLPAQKELFKNEDSNKASNNEQG